MLAIGQLLRATACRVDQDELAVHAHVDRGDPIALSLAPALTVCGLLVAVAVPARRASRVSAAVAMRDE